MGALFDQIRAAVVDERYIFSAHADERLRERKILAWQILAGMERAELLNERPLDRPNPSVETRLMLADGTAVHAVWAWLRRGAG